MKFDFIQCNFNMLDHRLIKSNLLKLINKDRTDLYTRTVLNFGIFTEKFLNSNYSFSMNDHRNKWILNK